MKLVPIPVATHPNLIQYKAWLKIEAYLFKGEFLTSNFSSYILKCTDYIILIINININI